jgi:hypothetical protein
MIMNVSVSVDSWRSGASSHGLGWSGIPEKLTSPLTRCAKN